MRMIHSVAHHELVKAGPLIPRGGWLKRQLCTNNEWEPFFGREACSSIADAVLVFGAIEDNPPEWRRQYACWWPQRGGGAPGHLNHLMQEPIDLGLG